MIPLRRFLNNSEFSSNFFLPCPSCSGLTFWLLAFWFSAFPPCLDHHFDFLTFRLFDVLTFQPSLKMAVPVTVNLAIRDGTARCSQWD